MTWANFFKRQPRCVECRTEHDLHQVVEGEHIIYVCSPCAITTGYVDFVPSLAQEIMDIIKEQPCLD